MNHYPSHRGILLPLLLLWLFLPVQSQEFKSLEIHNQNPALEKYKDYEAVVIEDLGKIRFEENAQSGGFDFVFERTTITKINSSTGLDRAEIEIPLYVLSSGQEKLLYARASVYNEDEGVIDYNTAYLNIYDEAYSEDLLLKKFAIPKVREGSIIKVSYGYRSPFKFHLRDWVFQDEVPVLHSKFEVVIIPFYEYALIKRGARPLTSQFYIDSPREKSYGMAKYKERTHVFIMTSLPAFEDESFMANRKDYIDRLEFQLAKVTNTSGISRNIMTDWPTTCQELLEDEDFGKYLSSARKQSKGVASLLNLEKVETTDAVDQVVSYVKSNYKWNGKQSKFTTKKFKKFREDKEGNTSEINLFMIGLLNAAGIEAYPVVLSTRAHGKVYKDTPMHTHFNYVLAYIPNDSDYLLRDATDLSYPNNQIPIKCLNGNGLLVDKENEQWINLAVNQSTSTIKNTTRLTIDPDLSVANLQVEVNSSGYDAVNHNRQIGCNADDAKQYFENDLISDPDSIVFLFSSTNNDSFGIQLNAEFPLEVVGQHIFLHPFVDLPEKECPLTRKSRSYPLDMVYQKSRHYHTEFNIPEGYTLDHIPDSYNVDNDLIKISYVPYIGPDGLVSIDADLVFKKRIYPTKDYRKLRAFYAESVKRFNEKISFELEVSGSSAGI